MTPEQLMIKRVIVENLWPGCAYKVGDILVEVNKQLEKFAKQGDDLQMKFIQHPNLYPKEDFIYNLWIHDLSKFSADEIFGYANYNRETGECKEQFERAWHHHKMHNPHHPEYWLNPNRSGELEMLPIPNIYILEMIADWMGASKTYGSTLEDWMPTNLPKFKFMNRSKVAELIRDFTGINVKMEERVLIVEKTD